MNDFFEKSIKEFLRDKNVDIYEVDYKNGESYAKIKDRIHYVSNEFMTTEEIIERYLLTEDDSYAYESIYDMGNSYKLDESECDDTALAEEIIELLRLHPSKNKKMLPEPDEIVNNFIRQGGLIERLNTYLNLDLKLFDYDNKEFKSERSKILYYFYLLEENNPQINILMMLSKPSMENIDNSFLGMKTYNGMFIKSIKETIGKELSQNKKSDIKQRVSNITMMWDVMLDTVRLLTDVWYEFGYNYDDKEIISSFRSRINEINLNSKTINHTYSPMESLYLRIVCNESLGNIMDIFNINNIKIESNYNVPLELIEGMKNFHKNIVEINSIEKYIDENALKIAPYVYLRKADKEDVRKIRANKGKVPQIIGFITRARPLENIKDVATELMIISSLQAIILDTSNEIFDYTFHGYQNYFKHKPRVQGALKTDKHVVDALKVYWVRKIMDHWYANIGRYNLRIVLREFENDCDSIMMKILKDLNIDEMAEKNKNYFVKKYVAILKMKEPLQKAMSLEYHLRDLGFKYIDYGYKICYIFIETNDILETYKALILKINGTLEDNKESLEINNGDIIKNDAHLGRIDCKLIFDYQNKECIMSELKQY